MGTYNRISRHGIHKAMWDRVNHRRLLQMTNRKLSADLGVSEWMLSRIVGELQQQGRIKSVARHYHSSHTWLVEDPACFEDDAVVK